MTGESAPDPREAATNTHAVMQQINGLGVGTAEYHEALWFLFSILARKQYAMAESLRVNQRRRDRATETRRARQEATR